MLGQIVILKRFIINTSHEMGHLIEGGFKKIHLKKDKYFNVNTKKKIIMRILYWILMI